MEPSQIFSPPESVVDEPLSPTKKSPPKRRSAKDARATRKSRASRISIASDAQELQASFPTPEPSASPEPASRQGTPLTDITESAINEQTPKPAVRSITPPEDVTEVTENVQTPKTEVKMEIKKVDAHVTKLDRPMDIVVKTRALGVPQTQEPADFDEFQVVCR
jgi:structural maintenance of chromosome 4